MQFIHNLFLRCSQKASMSVQDIRAFITRKLPILWRLYFTEGDININFDDEVIHIKLDIPVSHLYFEYSFMGYIKRAIELLGVNKFAVNKIRGVSTGDKEIYYQFLIKV